MRARMPILVLGAMLALGLPLSASASGPTSAQIRSAVRAAERSKQLWATINVCDTRRHPDQLGVRGEMPALGFTTSMYMTFEVIYQAPHKRSFTPLPSTKNTIYAGQSANSSIQRGETYPFKPSTALLAATVTFQWKRDGKVLASISRRTSAHHSHVDYSDPRGHSAAWCRIK